MGNPKKNWKLVWSDEFDAPEINRDYWNFEHGYVRNNELQKYVDTPENAYIKDISKSDFTASTSVGTAAISR